MNVQRRNDVSIYCLSAGTTLPEWLGDRARRNLSKTNESIRRRIELLQDFQMPASSSKLVQSADGRYILAAGTYPPRIRCYDVHDLTMKFERYVNASVVDMVVLGEDYGKLALLLDDRNVAFHAHYGAHESIRIPTFGRALAYESTTCDLLVAAKGNNIFRINLDEGRFSEPWTFTANASASSIAVHQQHPLASVGCDDGTVRFWDSRASDTLLKPFLQLDVSSATAGRGYADSYNLQVNEITSIANDSSGMYMAVGTGGGLVSLYDVRSSRPLYIQEHKLGLPIHTVKFHSSSGMILSSDEKIVKIWRYKSSSEKLVLDKEQNNINYDNENDSTALGAVKVNIEGNGKFSNFIIAGDENDSYGQKSGLILCATDQPKMDSFFVPAIGVAPKWCSFLENITEELEERDLKRDATDADDLVQTGQETVFENYKFVSRDDLEKLGVSNLIGTPLLRGYMHGFFMDINLYNRVKAVANPFEYEEYRKKKLKERLEAKQASRIAPRPNDKKKTKVNPDLADRLSQKAKDSTKSGQAAKGLLSDDRFGKLFTNPDFEIDEEDEDFKLRNPSGVAAVKNKETNFDSDEDDDEIPDDNDDVGLSDDHSSNDDQSSLDDDKEFSSDSDDDGFRGGKVRGEEYESMKELSRKQKEQEKQLRKASKKIKKKKVTMLEDDFAESADFGLDSNIVSEKARIRRDEMNIPLSERKSAQEQELAEKPLVRVQGGLRETTFIPKDAKRKIEEENARKTHGRERGSDKRSRRGVKDLRFKTPFKNSK